MGANFNYLFYLMKVDQKHDPAFKIGYVEYLKKINEVYKGSVRDFVMYSFINLNLVLTSNSYEKFKERQGPTLPYIAALGEQRFKNELSKALVKKESLLIERQVGKLAIPFSVKDSSANSFTLEHFKGKVVLIDFWASWCLPCRIENAAIKSMYQKYKDDQRLTILSIGVLDKYESWRKAITKDRPEWLQLFDSSGTMANSYFAHELPKFVIIDKNGMIANFQAPQPSDGDHLEKILLREMAK